MLKEAFARLFDMLDPVSLVCLRFAIFDFSGLITTRRMELDRSLLVNVLIARKFPVGCLYIHEFLLTLDLDMHSAKIRL